MDYSAMLPSAPGVPALEGPVAGRDSWVHFNFVDTGPHGLLFDQYNDKRPEQVPRTGPLAELPRGGSIESSSQRISVSPGGPPLKRFRPSRHLLSESLAA